MNQQWVQNTIDVFMMTVYIQLIDMILYFVENFNVKIYLATCEKNICVCFLCIYITEDWAVYLLDPFLDSGIHLEVNILNVILISKDE